jgi:hypothetical protein
LLFLEGALQQLNYEPPVRNVTLPLTLPLPTDREHALTWQQRR